MNQFTKLIAAPAQSEGAGCRKYSGAARRGLHHSVISGYRKEKTGNMDEVNIEAIAQANEKLSEMAKKGDYPQNHRDRETLRMN